MATQLPETFDPENQEGTDWELIPVGEYPATIIEIGVAQPRSGDGYYIAITWKIDEGDYENRQVWQRITFVHSSEQAQTIGRKQLKDLCNATGLAGEHVENVEVFFMKRAKIKLGIERDKDGIYNDKNKVTRILPIDPQAPQSPQQQPTPKPAGPNATAAKPQPQPKAAAAAKKPWHNNV